MSLAIVIATNRPESLKRWSEAWKQDLAGTAIYVVEDRPDGYSPGPFPSVDTYQYNWHDIDADLGANSWIIPRRTSAIKSYGFLKAFADGHDYIWTLDDDCFPEDARQGSYADVISRIFDCTVADHEWFNTMPYPGLYPRGYPYGIRKEKSIAVHHGLWSNIPDLDGVTALEHPDYRTNPAASLEVVPYGKLFPMCGMNLVFQREMTPAMYFMLQGHMNDGTKLPFDRFDDIWAGLFVKRVTDHLGFAVTTGYPSIVHTKESDPQMRVEKEAPGIVAHEILWRVIVDWGVKGATVADCYADLAEGVYGVGDDLPGYSNYFATLADAMYLWTELTA